MGASDSRTLNPLVASADERLMKRSGLAPTWAIVAAVIVGLISVVAYLRSDGSAWGAWIVVASQALVAVVIVISVLAERPVRSTPHLILACGFAIVAAATWFATDRLQSDPTPYPGDGEAMLLLAYPALLMAMIGLTSSRRNVRDPLAGAESIMYTIAATALVWVGITGPHFDGDTLPLSGLTWVWAYPALDGLLALLALVRARDGLRLPLLAIGFGLLGVGHAVVSWSAYEGRLEPGGWELALLIVAGVVISAAFAVPGEAPPAGDAPDAEVRWTQIFGLFVAALVSLGALSLMLAAGLASLSSSIVVAGATLSVIALAFVRLFRVIRDMRTVSEQRERDRLAAMVEHSTDVVVLADVDGRVQYASAGIRALVGQDPERWSGGQVLDLVVDTERDAARRHLERVIAHGPGGSAEFEATLANHDGPHRKATVVIATLVEGTAVDGIVVTLRDVTEQRNLERQLSHRAFHDELTGLANRALFLDRMDHALRVAHPEVDPVVVLFVDLDDFKLINDQYGHAVGDEVLRSVADRIRRTAGGSDTVARLGGDEFALLLDDRGSVERAIDIAEDLLEALREPLAIGGTDMSVLASVGVAVATSGMSTTGLLRDADIAMYEAKRAGKGQIRIFDPAMSLVATKHLEFRGDVAKAVENDQLRLVFMPYVDLVSGQVVGAEALIRWMHPAHGDVAAADFVPIAERTGAIVPIGYWAIDQAFHHASRWRPGLLVSMNVSPVQIRQPEFVDKVIAMADEHRIDPSSVVLELTEATLFDDAERSSRSITRLRDAGFRFAVDDFGAGRSSLTSLQRHPVDLVKIDRDAVNEFGSDPHGPTLTRTILQTASALGVMVVAEGIETAGQLRELRRLGCELGQGFLLSHPVEADALARRFGHPDALLTLP